MLPIPPVVESAHCDSVNLPTVRFTQPRERVDVPLASASWLLNRIAQYQPAASNGRG